MHNQYRKKGDITVNRIFIHKQNCKTKFEIEHTLKKIYFRERIIHHLHLFIMKYQIIMVIH